MTGTKVKYTASGVYIDKKDAVEASNRILTDALNGGLMTDTPKVREWTYYNCTQQQMMVAGHRTDGKCHHCKEVVHVVEADAYQSLLNHAKGLQKLLDAKIDPHYLRFEHLVKERDEAVAKANKYFNDWSRAHHLYGEALERAERLRERAAGLVEALEWYGRGFSRTEMKSWLDETREDFGHRAREAIKDWEGEKLGL
jgi:hypothetical protein